MARGPDPVPRSPIRSPDSFLADSGVGSTATVHGPPSPPLEGDPRTSIAVISPTVSRRRPVDLPHWSRRITSVDLVVTDF
jgi:hypothetical protein